jgi:hypothetical protein
MAGNHIPVTKGMPPVAIEWKVKCSHVIRQVGHCYAIQGPLQAVSPELVVGECSL